MSWFMYNVIKNNYDNLVYLIDHPNINSISKNLFFIVCDNVQKMQVQFLVPYFQFLYLSIRKTKNNNLVIYLNGKINVDLFLTIINEIKHTGIQKFGLLILICLRKKNLLSIEVTSLSSFIKLNNIISSNKFEIKKYAIILLNLIISDFCSSTLCSSFNFNLFDAIIEFIYFPDYQSIVYNILNVYLQKLKSFPNIYNQLQQKLQEDNLLELKE